MPVRNRRDRRRSELPDEVLHWLANGETPLLETDEDLADIWNAHRDIIVAEHIAEYPGSRPARWWDYDAPRMSAHGKYWDGDLPEHRRQVGGSGRQLPVMVPHSSRGIPALFDINWNDPPMFESEATYLDRQGMLPAIERRRLTGADFEPVTLTQ